MTYSGRWLLTTFVLFGISVTGLADERTDRVDRLFARWDTSTTPGCALGVIQDGNLIYEKGYGLAELEQNVRIGPDTVFHIASTSKQFTAFAILLLEKEGKLSLDDDVRKHLPELHDFGKTITIRHLLNHTSGLRDQWELVSLAGWRMEDVITDDDIFRLVCRQRELNFSPGDEYLYCNTGYTLAALIVGRASGRPFREFTKERIFDPLEMSQTRFPADHQAMIPHRARSYDDQSNGQYVNVVLSYSNVGATSLLTTVRDLARWDQNFYEPRVGDAALIARMQEVGKRNDGKPMDYALGLALGDYRGLKTVEHQGGDAGFRCTLLRFPTERFSVIILANAGECGPGELARRVADIYLEGKLQPVPAKPKPADRNEPAVDPSLLDAYAGEYRLSTDATVTITRRGGRLTAQATGHPRRMLTASSDRDFFIPDEEIRVTFDPPVNGKCPKILVNLFGEETSCSRVDRPSFTAEQLEAFTGEFWSEELEARYAVSRRGDALTIRHPRGVQDLHPIKDDQFESAYPIARVTFVRADDGRVTGFRIDNGRVRRVQFERGTFTPSR